nr:amidase [Bradyrhizobium sp. 173]
MTEYVDHDATGLASLVRAGEITPLELTRLARDAHDEVNGRLNAVIEFYEDAEAVAAADGGLLSGVPFLRKDIGAAESGRLQECGSRLFKGRRPQHESYFFHRAREAGLRPVGRTTLPELGTSGMSESIVNGITSNPWDLTRSAGGSSSGAAAAVAGGITPIAHGSDGGGSIRIPASWCGLVGLNPSRGRISGAPDRQDASFGLTREFILCRSVRDMAAALDVFSGPCPGDPFIITQPDRPYIAELLLPTGQLKVGLANAPWGAANVDREIRQAVDATAKLLENMGHAVTEIPTPYDSAEYFEVFATKRKLSAISLENAARAAGRPINADTLEPFNLKLYELGRDSEVGDLLEAQRKFRFRVGQAIHPFDILLTPTMPTVALPHDGIYRPTNARLTVEQFKEATDTLYPYLGVFNVTGQPSVSLPLAESASGLPIGIQVVGRFGDEATLVRVARDLEEATPWASRRSHVNAGNGSQLTD